MWNTHRYRGVFVDSVSKEPAGNSRRWVTWQDGTIPKFHGGIGMAETIPTGRFNSRSINLIGGVKPRNLFSNC